MKFAKFAKAPRFLQAIETSAGEFARKSKNNPMMGSGNEASEKEKADNARMARELKDSVGRSFGWAGIVMGAGTLLLGGGIPAAASWAAYGIAMRAGTNAALNVSERQHNDPDRHLSGVNSLGGMAVRSLTDTIKEMPGEIKKLPEEFRRDVRDARGGGPKTPGGRA